MGKKINLIGETFGYLKVLRRASAPPHLKTPQHSYWECECIFNNCGNKKIIRGAHLQSGHTTSCGCYVIYNNVHNNIEEAIRSSAKQIWAGNYSKLPFEYFYSISQQPCFYCGLPAYLSNKYNVFTGAGVRSSLFSKENGWYYYSGIDRLDSNQDHIQKNCVPACKFCNLFKSNMSLELFYQKVNNLNRIPIINIISINPLEKLNVLFSAQTQWKRKQNFFLRRIYDIKSFAKQRGIDFFLTQHQVAELIISPCAYCNSPADPDNLITNGIDRVNNDLVYVIENSFPCCRYCNTGKNDHTLEEFLTWINRIKDFQENKQVILISQESVTAIQ